MNNAHSLRDTLPTHTGRMKYMCIALSPFVRVMNTTPMMNVGIAITTAERRRRNNAYCSRTCMDLARSSIEGGLCMETVKGGDWEIVMAWMMVRMVKCDASGTYEISSMKSLEVVT